MAKSYVTYVGDSSSTTYAVTFPYLSKSHVNVLLDGVETTAFSWVTGSSIQLDTPHTGNVTIIRVTPTEPLVDFTDGSVLTENQLDIATVQSLYVAEETQDAAKYSLGNRPGDPDGPDGPSAPGDGVNWNAEGKKIINLANGTAASDAVNKGQLDAVAPGLEAIADKAQDSADDAEASALRAEAAADGVEADTEEAKAAAEAAKVSQDAAKVSEDNAKLSESAAKESETNAKTHEDNAKDSADKAKVSEDNAKGHADDAKASADSLDGIVGEVGDLVDEAEGHKDAAKISEDNAKKSADESAASALASKNSADKAEGHEKEAQAIVDAFNPALTLKGEVDITTTAPIGVEGDAYLNNTTGVADASWGSLAGTTVNKDTLIIYGDDNDWHASSLAVDTGDGIWIEDAGVARYKGGVAGEQFYIEQFDGDRDNYIKKYDDPDNTIEFASAFGGFKFLTDGAKEALELTRLGQVQTTQDIIANGKKVVTEAPEDGKQYARQDGDWSEVEASGGEASSPVTFRSGNVTAGQTPTTNADYSIQFETPETTEGGTFDGTYFTPNTAGWYQLSGSVFISAPTSSRVGCIIQKNGSSQLGSFNQGITALGGGGISTSGLVYCNGTTDKLSLAIVCSEAVGAIGGTTNTTWFSAHLVTGGSSSGGGTAEPMVWENKTAERAYDTVYTNTKDCPIYVQPYLERNSTDRMYVQFKIDGDLVFTEGGESISFNSPMFVVPSGSTYELVNTVTGTALKEWFEANVSGGSASGGGSGTPSSFARIVDKKPKTVAGGSSVAGVQVRDLNTIQYDDDNIVTLDSNDFTLQAGTYVINYSAPANKVEAHNVSLFDVTDNQTVNTGTANYTLDNASNTSYGNYSVTLTEPHTYRVTHTTEVAQANGLGNLNPVNDGIFTTVDIQKVGTGGASSGGSGGGSGWEETVLFENATGETSNFSLSESYDSFDYLRFDTIQPSGDNFKRSDMFPVNICDRLVIDNYYNYYMYLTCDDKTNYTVLGTDKVALLQVVGIKVGTGGGSGGDSIWTEEDGKATYDGDIEVNGVTVGKGKGNLNTVLGDGALSANTTAGDTVAVGNGALRLNDTGSRNTAVGYNSLTKATNVKENTAIGWGCLAKATEGSVNTGVGDSCLSSLLTGGYNTAVGNAALTSLTTGDQNVGIGRSAGNQLTTGSNVICIGYNSNPSSPSVSNEVTIGNDSITKTRLKGQVTMNDNLTVNTGEILVPNMTTTSESYNIPNCYISAGGQLVKHTSPSLYSIEEIDKKLAIKDKLIEKMSARLDKLEKRMK